MLAIHFGEYTTHRVAAADANDDAADDDADDGHGDEDDDYDDDGGEDDVVMATMARVMVALAVTVMAK